MKGYGYLISILSVVLLLIPPMKSAKDDPLILACLVGGALLSVAGMGLRWLADRHTQHRIDRAQGKDDSARDGGASFAPGR